MNTPADTSEPPVVKRRKRSVWRWLRLPIVAYLIVLLIAMLLENRLIYFPSVYPGGFWNPQFAYEDAHFTAEDGTQLHGWYLPHENPRGYMLFAHGNGGNLSHRGDIIWQMARELQVGLLIFDYRGYGRSEGSPSEPGILQDGRAARRWLAERAGVAESDLILFGESLGGAVVVDLAAADGARGLILQHTFSSLPEVAAFHYPWLPVRALMATQLNSAAKIGKYQGPLLQLHGDQDSIVPYELGQRLFAKANQPKQWVTIAGGDHNDYPPPRFYAALREFVAGLDADRAASNGQGD